VDQAAAFVETLEKTDDKGKLITVDDNAVCILKMCSGAVGQLTASWTYKGDEDNTTVIYCENGVIMLGANPDYPVEVHTSEHLHQLLPQANVLMVTLPLTEETRGIIGQDELKLLPPDAIVVNVGRGPVIDQEALYFTLKEGALHSAGIDVWYNYPLDPESRGNTPPADFPFHELDNVVMSPHRGGGAKDVEILRMSHLAQLLNAAAKGKPLPNQVDLSLGY